MRPPTHLSAIRTLPLALTRTQSRLTVRAALSFNPESATPRSISACSRHSFSAAPPSTCLRTMSSSSPPLPSSSSSSPPPRPSSPAATLTTQDPAPTVPKITFTKSLVPENPLGEGGYIRTAAALIIGDEILNGKTHDRNSHVFAQYCFEHGIDLKRIEVIADNEDEIIEASKRLVGKYDFVVTSGGIGPTHDDITYGSLAKAFGQPLQYHEETVYRLTEMTKHRPWVQQQNEEQRTATKRMALLPSGNEVETLFVGEDLWVPVVRLKGKLCVLPGIPSLFLKLLHLLTPFLPLPPKSERPLRIQVFTDRAESLIAPYLTTLQARLKPHGIQVGSYPILGQGVFVSLIGRDLPTLPSGNNDGNNNTKAQTRIWLAEVAKEVESEVGGKVVSEEEVALRKEKSAESIRASLKALQEKEGEEDVEKKKKAKI